MKVWENLKKLWKYSPVARVLTAFLALPNFYSCFYDNSIEIRYMLSISWIKKGDTTIDFIIHTSNFQFSAVDHYIDRCRRFVNTLDFKRSLTRRFANLSQAERLALRNLRRRTDVVIKPADKGGPVVVWARPLYIQEAQKQLSDQRFYEKLSADPLQDYQRKVKSTVNEMIATCALPPSAKNLVVTTPHTSRFYLLPKIHKPNNPRTTDSICL